jgi:hypothetical protein
MPPTRLKIPRQALLATILSLAFAGLAFPSQSMAGNLASDPNFVQRVDQFIYKPPPQDLVLKPGTDDTKPGKKPSKSGKH